MTATADLIDHFSTRLQSCEIQFRSFGRRTNFSGTISTLQVHHDNQLVRDAVHAQGDGRVLVIDGDASLRTALVGDLLASAARDNGWAGIVVYGAIRDAAVIDELDFAVKALGTNPRKSSKTGAGEVDVPVTFGGVTFVPGHFLWSDADGIVTAKELLEVPASPAGGGSDTRTRSDDRHGKPRE